MLRLKTSNSSSLCFRTICRTETGYESFLDKLGNEWPQTPDSSLAMQEIGLVVYQLIKQPTHFQNLTLLTILQQDAYTSLFHKIID